MKALTTRMLVSIAPSTGTPYFSKVGKVVDIAGWLKLFLIYVVALKCFRRLR